LFISFARKGQFTATDVFATQSAFI